MTDILPAHPVQNAVFFTDLGLCGQATVRSTGCLDAEGSDSEVWCVGGPALREISTELGGTIERK